MKSFIFTLAACAAIAMPAAEEVLFRSDFRNDRELKGWFDVGNSYIQGVPQAKPTKGLRFGKTIEDGGEIILKAEFLFSMRQRWNIITNVPTTFLPNQWAAYGISSKMSLPLFNSIDGTRLGYCQKCPMFGGARERKTVCNKRWPYGDLVWDIAKSVPFRKDGISQKV